MPTKNIIKALNALSKVNLDYFPLRYKLVNSSHDERIKFFNNFKACEDEIDIVLVLNRLKGVQNEKKY